MGSEDVTEHYITEGVNKIAETSTYPGVYIYFNFKTRSYGGCAVCGPGFLNFVDNFHLLNFAFKFFSSNVGHITRAV